MESYWRQHSKEASVEEMMLDSNAEELGKEEMPEIMAMLPDTSGMDVLELGAGIGYRVQIPRSITKRITSMFSTLLFKKYILNSLFVVYFVLCAFTFCVLGTAY